MLPFKAHHLLIGRRHMLPLPKLNSQQLGFLAAEVEKRGFAVRRKGGSFAATSGGSTVHVEQAGYCWSSKDPSDVLLPLIPGLLAFPRERVPTHVFSQMYFSVFLEDGVPSVKVHPRLEAASNWTRLRAAGGCGLTPDEHLATAALVGAAKLTGPLVTDFPTEEASPMLIGRRLYFRSVMSGPEAADALRGLGERKPRNCYVPRDGIFRDVEPSFARKCASEVAQDAAEWCFFEPE